MLSHRGRRTAVLGLLSAALSGLFAFAEAGAAPPPAAVAVITHLGVAEKRLDIDGLRAVFLRRRLVWSNGQHIVPLNSPNGHPLRATFDSIVLGFRAEQAARFWIDARIRSGVQAPRVIANSTTMLNVVRLLPGAIGYVPADQTSPAVRVVARVEGGRVLPP